jgi:hypothetical protein
MARPEVTVFHAANLTKPFSQDLENRSIDADRGRNQKNLNRRHLPFKSHLELNFSDRSADEDGRS